MALLYPYNDISQKYIYINIVFKVFLKTKKLKNK